MGHDPDPDRTLPADAGGPPTRAFDPALDAGRATAFGPELSPGGWSRPPLLRDDPADHPPLVHPSSPDVPRRAGDRYQLLGEIARGGMGVILKGRDTDLGRDLAFKVLNAELVGKAAAEQRFVEEAQVGGQLQHPGVVPVYELGRFADGRPYFTMKLVRGQTLAALLADRNSPDTDRGRFLKVFEQVAQTVAYAHSKGVIHRDVKPSNVMVGSFGEVQVVDWGLAKVLHRGGIADEERAKSTRRTVGDRGAADDPSAIRTARSGPGAESGTEAGLVLGTPAYMPPEQAGGETGKLDERADVFGLGAVLCVILTGQPPHVADDGEALRLMAIRADLEDAFARLDGCGADDELVLLCKRCLAPERGDRPRHAGEVAAAVAAYLTGVEDRAQRAEVERAEAEVRAGEQRKRWRVHAAFWMMLTAAVGLFGLGLWWHERQAATASAERAARQSRIAASVTAALDDARARTEEAWRLSDEPEKMRVTADLAQAAINRAEGFTSAGEPNPEEHQELSMARAAAADLDRHTNLFVAADLALRAHDIGPDGSPDGARTTDRLAKAFRQFGWDPVRTSAATIAGEIAAGRARNKVLGFLCDWEFQSARDEVVRQQIREVIRHTRVRAGGSLARWQAVMDGGDSAALVEFAARPDVLAMGPELLCALGRDLLVARQFEARLALLRRAVERYPAHVWVNFDLMQSSLSVNPPQKAEALRYAAAAATTRPDSALLQVNLGECLLALGAYRQSADVYRKALSLAPPFGAARNGLAASLDRLGDPAEAVAAYRGLVRADPNLAWARADLGKALYSLGDVDGAIAESREAIRLEPKLAIGHYYLALASLKRGAFEEAAGAFNTLAGLDPANAAAQKRNAATAERFQGLAKRLPAIKRREQEAATPAEALDFAWVCCTARHKEYALAVRLYTDAFAAEPKLLSPYSAHRYRAACAAVRLAAGDDPGAPVEVEEVAPLHKRARDWLAADLADLRTLTKSAKPESHQWAVSRLAQWTTDPDLESVRAPERRGGLAPEERKAWEELWADVEVVRKAAGPLRVPPAER